MTTPFQSSNLKIVSRFQVADCVAALRLLFWGTVLGFYHIKIDGFDLLDNTVGMVLIVVGLRRIARLPVTGRFKANVDFALYVAWVGLVHSVVNRMDIRWERSFLLLNEIVSCAYPVAIFLFAER